MSWAGLRGFRYGVSPSTCTSDERVCSRRRLRLRDQGPYFREASKTGPTLQPTRFRRIALRALGTGTSVNVATAAYKERSDRS